jgi:prepilin-type processing-associated H-X9-DG protein
MVAAARARAAVGPTRVAMSPDTTPPSYFSPARWVDVLVTTGICTAATLLILSAIQGSRFNARMMHCQNNLRQLGRALQGYSENHAGMFPSFPERGRTAFAGMYAPELYRLGLIPNAQWTICPDSRLADDPYHEILTPEEIEAAPPQRYLLIRGRIGGSYGYHLGVRIRGVYQPSKNRGRAYFVIMADAPGSSLPGFQSDNHGGKGLNALFEDGHVRFMSSSCPGDWSDNFYLNNDGLVAPGTDPDDAVVAPSGVSPFGEVDY